MLPILVTNRDPNEQKPQVDASLEKTKTLLDEIERFRTQAEEQFKAAETARRAADEHASYANQAKINTEEHSKSTASFKGKAESDQSSIAADKQKSDELLAALTRAKAEIDADSKTINAQRKQIDQGTTELVDAAQAGASHLEDIVASKEAIDKLLKEIQSDKDAAAKANVEATAARTTATQSANKTSTLEEQVGESKTATDGLREEIGKLLTDAKADKEELASILEHLKKSDATSINFEKRLEESARKMKELIATAEGLLPGFASTGLAHSFNEEKKRFLTPQTRWLRIFVGCIIGLGIVAAPSFVMALFGSKEDSWGAIFRGMAMRLPIVVPLVWLAIYAGRNYMLSIRLEEDYAYKEAISKAFEGYKREMKDIEAEDAAKPSPLTKLCDNVLTAISEPPGRIYEGKHRDITPFNEARSAAEKIATLSQKPIAKG